MAITPQDRQDYPYIIGYCHYIGSSEWWVGDQIRQAREYGAPRDAVRVWLDRESGQLEVRNIDDWSADGQRILAIEMKRLGLDCHEIT